MKHATALLMHVAEDLRLTDPKTYAALETATRAGCATLIQFECGPGATIAIGTRDDYGHVRWLHSCPLQ
jgi:hypothetical protein